MQVTVHAAIDEISATHWNQLRGTDKPFLRHEFLAIGEATGCVAPEQGWVPRHLAIHDNAGLRAAMPLYEKSHSWGEFVFDWAWANAYEQAGLEYYPKLVSCTPFTPATGQRLLLRDTDDTEARAALVAAAVELATTETFSSVHVQFAADDETTTLQGSGFLARKDCQFHWHNDGYKDFAAFLDTFSAKKRKNVKRERRRVRENGVTFRTLLGQDISTTEWTEVYDLISRTFLVRGSLPYFNQAFFENVAVALPDSVVVVRAELDGEAIAAAVFFCSPRRLWGRYWGSNGHHDSLHFETCYYQGIDFCIEQGIDVFEPGTQGEHKIARGFTPVETASHHWLAHPQFADAIERYLDAESQQVDRYMDAVHAHSPYRGPRNG